MQKKAIILGALTMLSFLVSAQPTSAKDVQACLKGVMVSCKALTIGACDSEAFTVPESLCEQPAPQEILDKYMKKAPTSTSRGGIIGMLPSCLTDTDWKTENNPCADVTIFLTLMFVVINYLFGIIGGVALLFFVYGGFVLILSQGNTEKISQGKSIVLSAVLGIIIAFSGYAIVSFVGDVLQVNKDYALISK